MEQTGISFADLSNSKGVKIFSYNSPNEVDYELKYSKTGKIKNYSGSVIKFNLGRDQWVTLPIILHRPIPKDGKITEAKLQLIERAGRYYYNVLFTVGFYDETKPIGQGICGLDIGWANDLKNDKVLTVGAIVGGLSQRLIVLDIGKHLHVQSVQSSTDKEFNEIKDYIQAKVDSGIELPKELDNFQKWRSSSRLRKILTYLSKNNNSFIDEKIDNWCKHLLHRKYVDYIRHDAHEQRKHHYRNIAAKIAKEYDTVVIEKMNLSKMGTQGEYAKTEAKTQYNWQLKAAAVNELRMTLENKGLKNYRN